MGRALSQAELERLNKVAKKSDDSIKHVNDWWQNDESLPVLVNAFQEGTNEVVLKGRTFTVRYPGDGRAWLQSTTAIAPCGWFDIDSFVRNYG